MPVTIVRKSETKESGLTGTENFEKVASQYDVLNKEMKMLSTLFAKKPTDNFTVAVPPYDTDDIINQGDIIVFPEGTAMYDKYIKSFKASGEATNMNLQKGVAMTGNHEFCPAPDAKWKITDGKITVENLLRRNNEQNWDAKLVECNKPCVLYHDEHGNVTMFAPKFLACIQVDAKTLREVQD